MSVGFLLLLATGGVLALVLLVLAAYRIQLGRKEDDHIHFTEGEATAVVQQVQVGHKLDLVERWSKILTIILVVYGLVLGGYYLYTLWQAQHSTVIMQ